MKANSQKMLYLARLHGYVCGDGSANFYSYSDRNPKAHLNIKIDDQACLDKIIEAFDRLSYSPNILEAKGKNGAWFTVQAQKEKIVREILSLGPVGSYKWRMPDLQKQQWVQEWVRAFFDSDATVTCVNKEITVESVNQAGLSHLRTILAEKFGICSHLKFRGDRKIYLLRICGKANLERFYNKIGFYHQRKQEKLRFILNLYQNYYGESWDLKARNSEEARRMLTDVFGHRGYFRVRVNRYGSFELGSHNSRLLLKLQTRFGNISGLNARSRPMITKNAVGFGSIDVMNYENFCCLNYLQKPRVLSHAEKEKPVRLFLCVLFYQKVISSIVPSLIQVEKCYGRVR